MPETWDDLLAQADGFVGQGGPLVEALAAAVRELRERIVTVDLDGRTIHYDKLAECEAALVWQGAWGDLRWKDLKLDMAAANVMLADEIAVCRVDQTPGVTRGQVEEAVSAAIGETFNPGEEANLHDYTRFVNDTTDAVMALLRGEGEPKPDEPADRLCSRSFASNPEIHVDPVEDAPGWGRCHTCGEVLNIQSARIPEHRMRGEGTDGG